jgi:hypothetical protein
LLTLIAALCYLPLAGQLGFYNDDWYLLYAQSGDNQANMMQVFAGDRPARGVLVAWLFDVWGTNALLYSLSAFVLRTIGAVGVWWLLRRIWPEQAAATYLAALLFVVYPGFLDQPNAVDYQSHQIAFALEILSLVLSVQVVGVRARWLKVTLTIAASLLALVSFLLMEYYIGLEGLRLLLLWAVCAPVGEKPALKTRLQNTLAYFALPFLVSAGFFYWRTVLFQGERVATNIAAIAGDVAGSPALRILWMAIRLFQDVINVTLVAWAEPLYRLVFTLRLKHFLLAGGIGVAALGLAVLAGILVRPDLTGFKKPVRSSPPWQVILLGLLGVISALIPVVFGDRHILFDGFSRFTLTASVGLAFLLAGVLAAMNPRLRIGVAAALIGLAAMTHTANAIRHAENWQVVRNFWWQVSWRVPQIEPGTLLMAAYADQGIAEDYFVWGPANLIYAPDVDVRLPITLTLTAATLNQSDVLNAQRAANVEHTRRGFNSEMDYSTTLVLSLPTSNACVHVLDGRSPEISAQDRPEIMLLAEYSHIERIGLDGDSPVPPAGIFGQPPAQGWCYFYEKADLARQRGDWAEAARLGDEALAQDFRPYDWIEWMPFAQAYAYTGQYDKLHDIAAVLRTDLFYRHEACQLVSANGDHPEGHQQLVDELCNP